jgi:hypothetical protein
MTNSGTHAIQVSSRFLNIFYSLRIYLTIISVAQTLHHKILVFSVNNYVEMILQETAIVLVDSNRGGPGSNPGLIMRDLWWTKWGWGRIYPSTSGSPANLHSTNFSPQSPSPIIWGWYNRPVVAAVPRDSVSPY